MFGAVIFLVLFGIIAIVAFLSLLLEGSEPKKEYGIASVTSQGENVRSIGEKKIADYFKENNINYVYEDNPIFSFNFRRFKISLPDFYLPDYDVYVEYWGLVNADDEWTRERYVKNMKRKMGIYHGKGIKFISIYPNNLKDLDLVFRRKFKQVTGFELPN